MSKKTISILIIIFAMTLCVSAQTKNKSDMNEYYIFKLRDDVVRTHVSYKNRYGIKVSADLYEPKTIDKQAKHPALVIGTPYGGVKEQGAGIYAMNMAERGYVAVAFDESYNGESGGEPRHVSSPDIFTEDFSAGVDFLGTLSYVDRERIGAIGICGSSAFALSAAQVDARIKAVATFSMYDISRVSQKGWEDSMTRQQWDEQIKKLSAQRWKDVDNGKPEYNPSFPKEVADSVPDGFDLISAEWWEFYAMKRGHHPRATGGFTTTSSMAFMNYPLLSHIDKISPRPILFVFGDIAHSRWFSEFAYKEAAEPKEMYIVKGARHIDLYDREDLIPWQKVDKFFKDNLKETTKKDK
jgi:fermentation-respiration switch protein FrsA (DUF1100 family)